MAEGQCCYRKSDNTYRATHFLRAACANSDEAGAAVTVPTGTDLAGVGAGATAITGAASTALSRLETGSSGSAITSGTVSCGAWGSSSLAAGASSVTGAGSCVGAATASVSGVAQGDAEVSSSADIKR